MCDKIASEYFIWQKYLYFSIINGQPRNQHCANCIGTLSQRLERFARPAGYAAANHTVKNSPNTSSYLEVAVVKVRGLGGLSPPASTLAEFAPPC